jgi:hypothetical protein
MQARRLAENPVITPEIHDSIDRNINGPSLVRVPDWVSDPLGEYYLYFAAHDGERIRLAYTDELPGPWTLHAPGALNLDDAGEGFDDHIASPDVHVDDDRERFRMYFHGANARYEDEAGETRQFTRVALSDDGLGFTVYEEPLGRFYFRVFEYADAHYALAKENRGENQSESGQRVYRSENGLTDFERGPLLFEDGSRHTAVRRRGNVLDVFYSRIGDAPERILHATVDLEPAWTDWEASEPETLLKPDREWEGAGRPVGQSQAGGVFEPVNGLRDPAVYRENGDTYLLYSVAGERGIAIAKLVE